MNRSFRTDDAARLVDALDRIANELGAMADLAEREATRHAYDFYYRFRRKLRDADTLVGILEERLSNLEEGRSADLDNQKRAILASILMNESRALVKFTYVLSANTFLPLGSQEIFLRDLARLEDLDSRLASATFTDGGGDEAISSLTIAREILTEMAEKAPPLVNFTNYVEAA
jgi:hypothetical protein